MSGQMTPPRRRMIDDMNDMAHRTYRLRSITNYAADGDVATV